MFGGGRGRDGILWARGTASKFLVQPRNFLLKTGGGCDLRLASTPHAVMQVALADGSVRAIRASVAPATWAAALTPGGGENLGNDW